MQWVAEHYQHSVQFLLVLLAVFPFVIVAILLGLVLGFVPSPLITSTMHLIKTQELSTAQHANLTESMIQINRVAVEYYDLLKIHSRESKRKEQLIQYLVLESCRRDNKEDPRKCDRLEHNLRVLDQKQL